MSVCAKGPYANNTNVKTDSDVDIAVQCHEVFYWANWQNHRFPHAVSFVVELPAGPLAPLAVSHYVDAILNS